MALLGGAEKLPGQYEAQRLHGVGARGWGLPKPVTRLTWHRGWALAKPSMKPSSEEARGWGVAEPGARHSQPTQPQGGLDLCRWEWTKPPPLSLFGGGGLSPQPT